VFHPRTKTLSESEAAYAAGLLDGEGSIILWKPKGSQSRRMRLRILIINTYEPVMDWLVSRIGGAIHRRQHASTNYSSNPLPIWTWTVHGSNAVAVLKQLMPFMIIKRDKAKLGIESQP
jgi:hypothetical protein